MWAFSSCGEWGLVCVEVLGLLIAVSSRSAARALGAQASVVVARGLSICGSWAVEHRLSSCGMGLVAGSLVVVHGLSCSAACGIFPDQGLILCPWQADSYISVDF